MLLKFVFRPTDFPATPLSLGKWSMPLGVISFTWLFATSCLLFLPATGPVAVDNMNWLCVVTGGIVTMATVNWFTNSRYHFIGPKRYDGKAVYAIGQLVKADDADDAKGGKDDQGGFVAGAVPGTSLDKAL